MLDKVSDMLSMIQIMGWRSIQYFISTILSRQTSLNIWCCVANFNPPWSDTRSDNPSFQPYPHFRLIETQIVVTEVRRSDRVSEAYSFALCKIFKEMHDLAKYINLSKHVCRLWVIQSAMFFHWRKIQLIFYERQEKISSYSPQSFFLALGKPNLIRVIKMYR